MGKPCIRAQGAPGNHGYHYVRRAGKQQLAHRVAYTETHGQIPVGMVVMHACDNRWCVEPSHLSVGTKGDNNRDAKAKGRAAVGQQRCPTSPFTEESVLAIRTEYAAGEATVAELARKYQTSYQGTYQVVARLRWRHI